MKFAIAEEAVEPFGLNLTCGLLVRGQIVLMPGDNTRVYCLVGESRYRRNALC